MTCTTTAYLPVPAQPHRLHAALMDVLAASPGAQLDGPATSYVDDESWGDLGVTCLRSSHGQGLNALLTVRFHPDGPMPTEHDEPPHILSVSFDTSWHYEHAGAQAMDLHAAMLAVLADSVLPPGAHFWFRCEDGPLLASDDVHELGDIFLGLAALGRAETAA